MMTQQRLSETPPRGAGRASRHALPKVLKLLLFGQSLVFLGTGLWPLFHMRSFQAVTGPKVDDWLVNTVGVVVTVIGAVLAVAGLRRRVGLETGLLGAGAAAGLASIDVYYVRKRRISPIYLLDAVLESVFITMWLAAAVRLRRMAGQARC